MRALKAARVIATLLAPKGVPAVISVAKTVAGKIAGNPYFPSPNPSVATFLANIAALEKSQSLALTRAKGAVEARDADLRTVLDNLHYLKTYVQQVADGDPGNAETIITSATFSVKKSRSSTKQDLTAKDGIVSGSVKLVAKAAAPRAAYQWQTSLDEKTWTDLPGSIQAHTIVLGLATGVIHYFRCRPWTKTGVGDWGQIVSLMVR